MQLGELVGFSKLPKSSPAEYSNNKVVRFRVCLITAIINDLAKGGSMSTSDHPCVTCGACCSYFQVSFDKTEVIEGIKSWTVPDYLAFEDGDGTLTMYGTDIPSRPRCIALKGKVGKFAICKNYENRPEVCRRFKASYSDGTHNPRCDEARMAHWLEPLSLSDWEKVAAS